MEEVYDSAPAVELVNKEAMSALHRHIDIVFHIILEVVMQKIVILEHRAVNKGVDDCIQNRFKNCLQEPFCEFPEISNGEQSKI